TPSYTPTVTSYSYDPCHHQHLHSFPTRRSSDLVERDGPVRRPAPRHPAHDRAPAPARRPRRRGARADGHLPRAVTAQSGNRARRSEEHTSELQSRGHLVCRLLLEKKKTKEYFYR